MNFTESDEYRFWAKVTKTDGCWLWTASQKPNGYGQFMVHPTLMYAHRVSWLMSGQELLEGEDLDHTCHVRHCVNPGHMRRTTRKQNLENTRKLSSRNTSGHRGVSWHAASGKWHARVSHHNRTVHVGIFADKQAAVDAVIAKRNALFTHNDLDRTAR
jgi:hypothetical protein